MWAIATLTVLICVGAAITPDHASGFTTSRVLDNGTPADPSDDLQDAARWTNAPGSLVEQNVRGLGGGVEYAIAAELCSKLIPRFVESPPPTCDQVHEAIRGAFDRWSEGHPVLRFVDVSGRIQPLLPPPNARDPWLGFGAEIDILALSPQEFPRVAGLGAYTGFWFLRRSPVGTNGRLLPGNTLTSVDIVVNTTSCYHLDPGLTGGRCNHFGSLMLHEIGHALGLDHPNELPHRNFDTDDDPNNNIPISCEEPTRGLRLSNVIDHHAVMNGTMGQAEPVHTALRNDDLGGRNFHYPICPTPQAPAGIDPWQWIAAGLIAASITTLKSPRRPQ